MAEGRLIIEVSSLLRADGTATGISRVSHELCRWAVSNRDDVRLVAMDWIYHYGQLRALDTAIMAGWLDKSVVIDTFLLPDRGRTNKIRVREHLPLALRYLIMWLQHPRRALVLQLERWRQRAKSKAVAERIGRLQERFLTDKYRRELSIKDGSRAQFVSYKVAMEEFVPRRGDVLVLTGADWGVTDPKVYVELQRQHGVRIVWMCYDIIALRYPQFFEKENVGNFRDYAHVVLPIADLVLVSAHAIENDVVRYCAEQNFRTPQVRVVPYGSNLTRSDVAVDAPLNAPLGHGLKPGGYAMFVSTVEPRKGHRTLLSVWKRLLADGVPQAADFDLVFVGRAGWMVKELMADMKSLHGTDGRFRHLTGVGDGELAALYRNAAFCLYPSLYEGYGLPIVESFAYGKAVLASSGGALQEVVGEFSPTLDPLDEEGWYQVIRRWIENPADRVPYEQAIRTRYRHPTWNEAAQTFFATVDEALGR